MSGGGEITFLVESYVPLLDRRAAAVITSRYRGAARQLEQEGVALRWVRSFAVIDDETYLCVVATPDRDNVMRLSTRAGLDHDHVVEVIAIDACDRQSP